MKLKTGDLIGYCTQFYPAGSNNCWERWDGDVGLVIEIIDEENFKVKWRHPDGTHSVSIEGGDLDNYQQMKDILASKDA